MNFYDGTIIFCGRDSICGKYPLFTYNRYENNYYNLAGLIIIYVGLQSAGTWDIVCQSTGGLVVMSPPSDPKAVGSNPQAR